MEPEAIRALIRAHLPDAEVECQDLTGTRDHWKLTVRSNAFRGLRLLEQHRLVKQALDDKLRDRTLHALTLQTQTLD